MQVRTSKNYVHGFIYILIHPASLSGVVFLTPKSLFHVSSWIIYTHAYLHAYVNIQKHRYMFIYVCVRFFFSFCTWIWVSSCASMFSSFHFFLFFFFFFFIFYLFFYFLSFNISYSLVSVFYPFIGYDDPYYDNYDLDVDADADIDEKWFQGRDG